MYELTTLELLAEDQQFAAHVRTTANELLALAAAGPTQWMEHVAPLLRYGPSQAGSLVRFARVPDLLAAAAQYGLDLDERLVQQCCRIVAQLEAARP